MYEHAKFHMNDKGNDCNENGVIVDDNDSEIDNHLA